MANPTQQVPTESVSFSEEKVYWPLNPANTSDTIYNGEMMGMRLDTGFANHFDDSTPMIFLGTKEGITHRLQSDTPATDFKELLRRPKLFSLALNTNVTATATIPASIGSPAYAADSGHVQLSTSGLTNNNLAGMVVDISRSYSVGSTGGILSLTTASTTPAVTVAPPTWGALIGLIVYGPPAAGSGGAAAANQLITGGAGAASASVVGTAGGAGSSLNVTMGAGGAQSVASGTAAAGAGGSINLTLGAGGNALGSGSTGNGGAGGSLVVTCGAGGTTTGGSAGAPGNVKLAAGNDPAGATPTLILNPTDTTTGNVTDGYTGGIRLTPVIGGANTVTRWNGIDVNNVTGAATVTNGCIFRFNAAAGTHVCVDSGTSKTTPGTVTQWLKVNVNGTVAYIPTYSSKTS